METNESSRMAVLRRVGTAMVDILRRPFEVGKDDPKRLSFRNVAGQFLTESGGPLATGDELVRRKILEPRLLEEPNRRGETIGYVVVNRKRLEEIWKSPENVDPAN